MHSKKQQLFRLIQKFGVFRSKELEKYQIPRKFLQELYQEGEIERVAYGVYTLFEPKKLTENHSFAIACKRVPQGIFCLFSSLQFHQLTTQEPFQVWMALPTRSRTPKELLLPLHFVRFSGQSFSEGVEKHIIEGVSIRVYNVPKTIADLFKFRHQIGLDVALEALKEGWRNQIFRIDDLWYYAKICHVSNILRPYLEMLE